MKRLKCFFIAILFLLVVGCKEGQRRDGVTTYADIFQKVGKYDTVWVKPSGTVFILGAQIKSFDISEYSITGMNRNDSIFLAGGFNNLEPNVAKLFVLLDNDSTKEFTVALSDSKGSFYAYLEQNNK